MALTLSLAVTVPSPAATSAAPVWQDAEIGNPAAAGSHTDADGAITVIGAGKGDHGDRSDQLHFTYFLHPGDIDVIAHLASFTGEAPARAGIMLRSGNDAGASTAAIAYGYDNSPDGNNSVFVDARDQPTQTSLSSGVKTRITEPWLRLVRIGDDFGVYKSADGRIWSSLGNVSGWRFATSGPVEAGFFAASGNPAVTSTATFDHVHIGPPAMGYESSWFGDSFGARAGDGHVSNGIGALWTAPDGRCYTNSLWDEAGAASNLYQDGKVVTAYHRGNWMIGNNACAEGSITGDGQNLYLLASGHEGNVLLKTDALATLAASVPMYMSFDAFGPINGSNLNAISGLAAANHEVYLSDARANLIRVAQTSLPIYYTAGNSTVNLTTHPIDTSGVAHAAPEVVYQSQRACDGLPYVVPGLDPGLTYTVRCHFAEYTETGPHRRLIDVAVSGAPTVKGFDVVAAAGGPFKAAVLEVPGAHPDVQGNLRISFVRTQGGDGQIVICGFEILKPDGTQAFALDCAGPAAGGFQPETYDLPARSFAFQRPGPMVADARGDLWIIREANDFPVGTIMTTKYPGAILCYHPDGTFTNKQITDVANPVALAYDAVQDRLLVADNGPNQNIRCYSNLKTAPALSGTFGQPGGIFGQAQSAPHPDEPNGGYDRLFGLTGVGVDAQENIYVSCGLQGTDLRKFTPSGHLVWILNGAMFCNTPGLDPASDGTRAYSVYYRSALDYSKNVPGSEWSYQGYCWNPIKYGPPPRQGNAQTIVRRVGPGQAPMLYTSGQGSVDYAGIFRLSGDTIVPCGQIRKNGTEIWIDANGDGLETPDEVTTSPSNGGLCRFSVDQKGDIWMTLLGSTPFVRHFRFLGLNAHGAPLYDLKPGDYEDIPFPGNGQQVSTYAQLADAVYDAGRDAMYLLGPAANRHIWHQDVLSYLARYDHWSAGNRTPRWLITLPDPATDPNFQYEVGDPQGLGFQWMGMDVADDKLFIAALTGNIDVFNTADGTLDRVVTPGPEVDGGCAWEDASMGLTAFKRKNGEFVVIEENSGWGGKANMFRIPRAGVQLPPGS